MKAIPIAKYLLIGAATETCLATLAWFLRIKDLLVIFVGFPGILVSMTLGTSIHDDRFFWWVGAPISFLFWSFAFAFFVLGIRWALSKARPARLT